MINKRKLIQLIVANNPSENSFYDLKQNLDIKSVKGKASLLKHVTALSNSNPFNNSFLIYGIADESKKIIGIEYMDDSNIQNLLKSNLDNCPEILFDNVYFPELEKGRYIGLLTISPQVKICRFKKSIWKIPKFSVYKRQGSQSAPISESDYQIENLNEKLVKDIENNSKVTLSTLLNDTLEFYKDTIESYHPNHTVYNDQYVICYSGWREDRDPPNWSEVTVKLINESVDLFFSATKSLSIETSGSQFKIIEYAWIWFRGKGELLPLEETVLNFIDNGEYTISKRCIFTIPQIDPMSVKDIENDYFRLTKKRQSNTRLTSDELNIGEGISSELMICIMNGFQEAKKMFDDLCPFLDGAAAECHSEAKRILDMCYKNSLIKV